MNCPVCGSPLEDGAKFCTVCGTSITGESAPKTAPQPQMNVQQNTAAIADQYRPVSPWGYFGLNILFAIPIVGFICLLVFTFSNKNINRRNYARSYWCALLVAIIVSVVVFAVAYATGAINEVSTAIEKYFSNVGYMY